VTHLSPIKIAPDHPIHLIVGLTLWSLWFIGIYAGVSIYCTHEDPASAVGGKSAKLALWLATGVTGLTLTLLAIICWKQGAGFTAQVSAGLYIAAAIATVAVAIPASGLPLCQ